MANIEEYTQKTEQLLSEQQELPVTVIKENKKISNVIASAAITSTTKADAVIPANPTASMSEETEKKTVSNEVENIQSKEIKDISSEITETKTQTEESENDKSSLNVQTAKSSPAKIINEKSKKKRIKRWGFGMGAGSLSTEFSSISSFGDMASNYANMVEHPEREILIAGSVGPTNKTASMSPDVNDPAYRAVTYMDLYQAYTEQIEALIESGVDIILFETTFDTLNAKAGLEAADAVLKAKGKDMQQKQQVSQQQKTRKKLWAKMMVNFTLALSVQADVVRNILTMFFLFPETRL